jgi:hypothetical protein
MRLNATFLRSIALLHQFFMIWLNLRFPVTYSLTKRLRRGTMKTPSGRTSIKFATLLISSIATVVGLSACEVNVSSDELKGSGKISTEVRTVSTFDSISNATPFDVIVTAEGAVGVSVVGDDNLVGEVETIVEGNTLIIRNKRKGGFHTSWNHTPVTVKVTMPVLNKLSSTGSGDIRLLKLNGEKLAILSDGSGDIQASGTVTEAQVTSNGSGDLDLAQLHTGKFTLAQNGSGDAHLSGITQSLDIEMHGSGDLEAESLQVERATVKIHGPGSATLNGIVKSLNAELNGSGDMFVDKLQADQANIVMHGPGEVKLTGEVKQLTATISGSGDLDTDGLLIGNAVIKNSGPGNISGGTISGSLKVESSGSGDLELKFKSAEQIDANMSGPGSLTFEGSAKNLSTLLSGSGDLHATSLLLEHASVKVTGPGEAAVNVKSASSDKSTTSSGSRVVKVDRTGVVQ